MPFRILNNHPIDFTTALISKFNLEDAKFHFKFYSYDRNAENVSVETIEEEFTFSGRNIDDYTISNYLQNLNSRPNINMVFNSLVIKSDGTRWHIPMIDFNLSANSTENHKFDEFANKMRGFHPGSNIWIYKSGRSFHGYVDTLIETSELDNYLTGLILTQNPLEHVSTSDIDIRWAAHQLRHKMMGLRWSCNGNYYQQLPSYVYKTVIPSKVIAPRTPQRPRRAGLLGRIYNSFSVGMDGTITEAEPVTDYHGNPIF